MLRVACCVLRVACCVLRIMHYVLSIVKISILLNILSHCGCIVSQFYSKREPILLKRFSKISILLNILGHCG